MWLSRVLFLSRCVYQAVIKCWKLYGGWFQTYLSTTHLPPCDADLAPQHCTQADIALKQAAYAPNTNHPFAHLNCVDQTWILCAGHGAANHFHCQSRHHHHAEVAHLSTGCGQPPFWQVSSHPAHSVCMHILPTSRLFRLNWDDAKLHHKFCLRLRTMKGNAETHPKHRKRKEKTSFWR